MIIVLDFNGFCIIVYGRAKADIQHCYAWFRLIAVGTLCEVRPPLHRGNNACALLLPPQIVQGCHEMLNGGNSIVVEVCKWLTGSEQIATECHEGRG